MKNILLLGYNGDVSNQIKILYDILKENDVLYQIITKAIDLGISNYFIGAGCICQSVWNYQNGFEPMYGISDIDFVYFDDKDLSYEAEHLMINQIKNTFSNINMQIDIKNEARVHLWYKSHFGYTINPYSSIESAINTWPTTASSIGVRIKNDELVVYAPFGMNDMFGQIVRANKIQITEEIYIKKCEKWKRKWENLTITKW